MGAWVRPIWTLHSQLDNSLPAATRANAAAQVYKVDFVPKTDSRYPKRTEWSTSATASSVNCKLTGVLSQNDQKRAGRNTSSEILCAVSRDAQSGRLLGACWKLRLPSSVCHVTLWTPCAARQCGFRVQEKSSRNSLRVVLAVLVSHFQV